MITEKETIRLSKFLSLVLRHAPETIELQLDEQGWANVSDLLKKVKAAGHAINPEILDHIVETNSKKRFAFSGGKRKIRASQGHSIWLDLGYEPQVPPRILYHGTSSKALSAIMKSGIEKRNRVHVHLSTDKETAMKVGQRHGTPVVLEVSAAEMQEAGYQFFLSANGIWLTDSVPAEFLKVEF